MKTKLLTMLLLMITLIACSSDENDNQILNGEYSGIFTVEYPDGRIYTNNATVTFSEKYNYESSGNGNSNDYYPSGGNGTYEIGESIINFYDVNIWLTNFDTHLVLGGEYDYSENEDKLIVFSKQNNIGFYKYELTKD